jgi:phosphoglucosamine mutase
MLEAAVSAGIASAGGQAYVTGVIPTPGVSRLVSADGFDGGVIISASHNPFADNGIKLLGRDGKKLPDAVELDVEARLADMGAPLESGPSGVAGDRVGTIEVFPGAVARYVDDLLGAVKVDLSGLRVLLDCAHGAAYQAAPLAFAAAGAYVETAFARPDGVNINAECGSTHPGALASLVVQGQFDLGLAFDGDADRVLAVDRAGNIVDGDQILTLLTAWLMEQGRLPGDTVVVTSMSNLGFHRAMRERDVRVEITDVGDRYVLERMEQVGAALGGEQSGHVIYLPAGATGDGLQTGLLLCQAMRHWGRPLEELAGTMRRFPQLLVNVRALRKDRLEAAAEVWEAVRQEETALGDEGRIVLRPSGTEPLVRVMVEAPTEVRCREVAERLVVVVERALG